jgi:hypothetical protein
MANVLACGGGSPRVYGELQGTPQREILLGRGRLKN